MCINRKWVCKSKSNSIILKRFDQTLELPVAKCNHFNSNGDNISMYCWLSCKYPNSDHRFFTFLLLKPQRQTERGKNMQLLPLRWDMMWRTHRFAWHGAEGAEAVAVCDHHGRGETWRVGILWGLLLVRIHCRGKSDRFNYISTLQHKNSICCRVLNVYDDQKVAKSLLKKIWSKI